MENEGLREGSCCSMCVALGEIERNFVRYGTEDPKPGVEDIDRATATVPHARLASPATCSERL
jgi:hypothetical protein